MNPVLNIFMTKHIRDEGAGYTPSPAKKPRCRDYDEKGFCLRGDLCKFDHGTDAVVLEDAGGKVLLAISQ